MNRTCNPLLIFVFLYFSWVKIQAQGCSDAGFCTIGAMRPSQPYERDIKITLKSVELSQYIARTVLEDFIYASTLDFNLGVSNNDAIQFKLPYMVAEGSLGKSHGIGDVSLGYTRTIKKTSSHQLNATLGTKITLGQSKKELEGKPLPMYYQQNLGTYDFILGLSFMNDKWLIASGLQLPFAANNNKFIWKPWIQGGTSRQDIQQYPSSIDLNRGNDMMFRIERSIRKSNWEVNMGLLAIYRLNEDERTNPKTKERELVENSDGLALTVLFGFKYRFNVNSSMKLIFGQRILKKKINLDGLSREQVLEVGYVYSF